MSYNYTSIKNQKTMNNNPSTEIKTEANLGLRILSGFIDYFVIYVFFFVYVYTFGQPNEEGGYSVSGLPALVPVVFWGIMTVGLEQLFGVTIGNFLAGLKPVSINGVDRKLSFGQSLIRHLLDPVDMFFFGLVGILTIKNSDKHQRVGDIVAKTIVVKASKTE